MSPKFTWVDYLLIAIIVGGLGIGVTLWLKRLSVSVKTAASNQQSAVKGVSVVSSSIWIDISGAVEKPGVYQMENEARVKDVLVVAGGLASNADRDYVAQSLNLAERLVDGQKIYIPAKSAESAKSQQGVNRSEKININKASVGELETLSGIGSVRAQAIIDARPYRAVEDLISRKIVPASVFEKIKMKISVY